MNAPSYRIVDEPVRSRWDNLAVRPFWPLLALMIGGAWLSFPWSALNAFALGTPTRVRDLLLVVGAFAGSFLFAIAFRLAAGYGVVSERSAPWAMLVLTLWKLFVGYFLFAHQQRAAGLREYFGGPLRNGALVALALGHFGRSWLVSALLAHHSLILLMVLV